MYIRLTFSSEDDLMQRCYLPLRLGVLFLPSARLAEPGSPCELHFDVRGHGPVLRARGLVAGASAIEDEKRVRQGMWIRLVELDFVETELGSWLEAIGASIQPGQELGTAAVSASSDSGATAEAAASARPPDDSPRSLPDDAGLIEPGKEEDLGWLSGSLRRSGPLDS